MSWNAYIEHLIARTKDANGTTHADRVCIVGLDGSKWTTDDHEYAFKVTPDKAANICQCFKSGDFTYFMPTGVFVEAVRYQFLREIDKKVVLAKKGGFGAVSMQMSKTALVIAHCPEGGQQGNTNKGVGVIAEYLESLNM